MTKTCTHCKEVKDTSDFYLMKTGKYRSYCKVCSRAENTEWHKTHHVYRRSAQLKHNYGISLDDYEKMLASQNGSCAICEKTVAANGKFLSVDHDHATGKVRALLCDQCNCGLGNFNENPLLFLRALKYLGEHCGS